MKTFAARDNNHSTLWLALALAIATIIVFAPAIRFDYLDYDDGVYVYGNKAVLQGLGSGSLRYAFTSIDGGSWMPLTWLSHMADISLFGNAPDGPHAVNILLHSLNAALLFLALHRMTGQTRPSLCIAALFALHPLRSESVIWIAERKDVLCALFYILGIFTHARYVSETRTQGDKIRMFRILTLICLALGLMAKPMSVTFPFALLLLDFWPLCRFGDDWNSLRRNLWPLMREKAIMFLLIAMASIATFQTQKQTGAMAGHDGSLAENVANLIGNYGFYASKVFLPTNLCILYPMQTASFGDAAQVALALAVITGLALRLAFRAPWMLTGWFWFLGTLVPVVGVIPVGHISVAERYTYLPSIGLTLSAVWMIAECVRRHPALRTATIALGITAILTCAALTRADLSRWRNSIAMFQSAIKTHPHPVAYNNIAVCYMDRGEYAHAIEPLTLAIQMDTNYIKAFINRAYAYDKMGRRDEAIRDYEVLLNIEPKNAEGFNNRADVLMDMGRLDEAIRDFSSAIRLEPKSAPAYNNRANAHFMKGNLDEAITDAGKAIDLAPRYANAYNTRGNCFHRRRDFSHALADYGRAISCSPYDPLTYNNRAAVHLQLKQFDLAWKDIIRCRELGGKPHEGLVRALTEATGRSY